MIDSTKTFLKAAKALLENGATKVGFLFSLFPFFSYCYYHLSEM